MEKSLHGHEQFGKKHKFCIQIFYAYACLINEQLLLHNVPNICMKIADDHVAI